MLHLTSPTGATPSPCVYMHRYGFSVCLRILGVCGHAHSLRWQQHDGVASSLGGAGALHELGRWTKGRDTHTHTRGEIWNQKKTAEKGGNGKGKRARGNLQALVHTDLDFIQIGIALVVGARYTGDIAPNVIGNGTLNVQGGVFCKWHIECQSHSEQDM